MRTSDVSLKLRPDEALVLFDLLGRWIEDEKGRAVRPLTKHEAELWVLNGLYCTLETKLAEPFRPDYTDLLAKAREDLCHRNGGDWPWLS